MILLYELSIWLAWFDARAQKKREQKEEEERLARLLSHPPVAEEPCDEIEQEETAVDHDDSYVPHDAYATEEGEEEDLGDPQEPREKSE
jgi:hypothetical protein